MEPVSRDGIPRVLFAGEATEPRSYSTVHGARWVLCLGGRRCQKTQWILFHFNFFVRPFHARIDWNLPSLLDSLGCVRPTELPPSIRSDQYGERRKPKYFDLQLTVGARNGPVWAQKQRPKRNQSQLRKLAARCLQGSKCPSISYRM